MLWAACLLEFAMAGALIVGYKVRPIGAFAMRHVVLADWLFTVPSDLIMPITGLLMTGWAWDQAWIQWGIGLYASTPLRALSGSPQP